MFKQLRTQLNNRKLVYYAAGLGVSTLAVNLYHPVYLESINSVIVDKSLTPFPTSLKDYKLLGYGMRQVTFLGFNVYGIGIYFNTKDSNKIKSILSHYDLAKDLDDAKSVEIISQIIENTDFKIRISPVRNTDFTHLKDGFIKLILASPLKKNYGDKVNEGLDQLRDVFQPFRGSVPKNHVLLITTERGKLTITYENTKSGEIKVMGQVDEPAISKLLLLCYLSNAKPLSEALRKSCNEGWNNL